MGLHGLPQIFQVTVWLLFLASSNPEAALGRQKHDIPFLIGATPCLGLDTAHAEANLTSRIPQITVTLEVSSIMA